MALHRRWRTRSWHRNVLTRGFHLLVMLVIGGAVKDTQCGFKVKHAVRNPRVLSTMQGCGSRWTQAAWSWCRA